MRVRVTGFTIDAETSRDLDDALWIVENEDGTTTLFIHIADVSDCIEIGSENDKLACVSVETSYFVDSNKPMIPRELAEDKLSLLPNVERNTVTISCVFDSGGRLQSSKIFESVLVSQEKFSYENAEKLLFEDGFSQPLANQIKLCNVWAQKLQIARKRDGALSGIDLLLANTSIDEDGTIVVYNFRVEQVVSEFMILANTIVANTAAKGNLPFLYRNQAAKTIAPPTEKLASSIIGASRLAIEDVGLAHLDGMLSNWLERASYNHYVLGHFALALNAYCHFTSPIRRYADLVNHRILKAYLLEQPCPYTLVELEDLSAHINTRKNEIREIALNKYKEKDERIKGTVVARQMRLDGICPKDFTKTLKYALTSNSTAQIKLEVIRRLDEKLLHPMDYCLLLFMASDKDLRQRTLSAITESPHIAISALTAKCQIDTDWAECKWIIEGVEGQDCFTAWTVMVVKGEELTSTHPGQARTKQSAKSTAAIEFLKAYTDGILVPPEDRQIPVAAPKAIAEVLSVTVSAEDIEKTNNHVGLIQEIALQTKQPMPEYLFVNSLEENGLPIFTCTCTLAWSETTCAGQGTSSTKKGAKQKAAKSVLETLSRIWQGTLGTEVGRDSSDCCQYQMR